MPVHIQQLKDHEILVNKKLVVKDTSNNWVTKVDLTETEIRAFQEHVASL